MNLHSDGLLSGDEITDATRRASSDSDEPGSFGIWPPASNDTGGSMTSAFETNDSLGWQSVVTPYISADIGSNSRLPLHVTMPSPFGYHTPGEGWIWQCPCGVFEDAFSTLGHAARDYAAHQDKHDNGALPAWLVIKPPESRRGRRKRKREEIA